MATYKQIRVRCKICGEELDCTPNRYVVVTCKCGKASADAEEHYLRLIGEVEVIK